MEFFKNSQNFKEEIKMDTFSIKWLELNNNISRDFSEEIYSKVFSIFEKFHKFYKMFFQNNNVFNIGLNGANNGFYNWQGGNNRFEKNDKVSTNKYSNYNYYEEKSGKYTCRFEILLDNDKDFQIARKLIGAKGCNMKRIVDSCGNSDYNDVKLRLRGKGSGFKEGPHNQESDDPLHLCISSKNYDTYGYACSLVEELLQTVYDEYRKHCSKFNKQPLQRIYVKKEEGISRKSTQGTNFSNNYMMGYGGMDY